MSNNNIHKALYALPDVNIVARRKPLTIPLVLLFVGMVLFAINPLIDSTIQMSSLKSAIILFGAVLVVVGILMTLFRLMGDSYVPFHVDDKCYLQREELRFEKNKSSYIIDLILKEDFITLRSLKQDGVSAVTVVIYSSPISGFCACQAFEYVELEQRPLCKMTYKK